MFRFCWGRLGIRRIGGVRRGLGRGGGEEVGGWEKGEEMDGWEV
jgi:hypothetical protein